jgi:hypothetical protein
VNIIKMAPKANDLNGAGKGISNGPRWARGALDKGKGKAYEVLGKGKRKGKAVVKAVAKVKAKAKPRAKAKPKARQRPAAAPVPAVVAAAPVAAPVAAAVAPVRAVVAPWLVAHFQGGQDEFNHWRAWRDAGRVGPRPQSADHYDYIVDGINT